MSSAIVEHVVIKYNSYRRICNFDRSEIYFGQFVMIYVYIPGLAGRGPLSLWFTDFCSNLIMPLLRSMSIDSKLSWQKYVSENDMD